MYVCMYVCTYMCMYVFMYLCVHEAHRVGTHVTCSSRTDVCMYICMCVCMHVCMHVCACMQVYILSYVYVCKAHRQFKHTHTHTHTLSLSHKTKCITPCAKTTIAPKKYCEANSPFAAPSLFVLSELRCMGLRHGGIVNYDN